MREGEIGAQQSSRNWGRVRKMGRDPRELPLMGGLDTKSDWRAEPQKAAPTVALAARRCSPAAPCAALVRQGGRGSNPQPIIGLCARGHGRALTRACLD